MSEQMQERFMKDQWSPERKAIDDMEIGEQKQFPTDKWNAVLSACHRMSDAHTDRRWRFSQVGYRKTGMITVYCEEPKRRARP